MFSPKIAPFGSWKSPLTAEKIAGAVMRMRETTFDGKNLYWVEQRTSEGGRNVIVCRKPDGTIEDITPPPFSARTLVYEYGGGGYSVHQDTVYFSNFSDQRVYRQDPGSPPSPITPEGKFRFSDWCYDEKRGALISVMEDHSLPSSEAIHRLVSIDHSGLKPIRHLKQGADFYASPRLSPDGKRLAWLSWNHPQMPWDGTELWVGDYKSDGSLENVMKIAGGDTDSICQPTWSPNGKLIFVSDRNNWWNLYEWNGRDIRCLLETKTEFALAQWSLRPSQFTFIDESTLLAAYNDRGFWSLGKLDLKSGQWNTYPLPFTEYKYLSSNGRDIAFIAGSWSKAQSINLWKLESPAPTALRFCNEVGIEDAYYSEPERIEFDTAKGKRAHAFYYPPTNPDFTGPKDELPPLLVISHGGPTGASEATLWLGTQFWTSRGFAVVDVNYRGSTGFGRSYRNELLGNWGVADVEDCIHAAKHLVRQKLANPKKICVRGGSAGGYTTLCGVTFHEFFSAGCCFFGISDIEMIARDTHKYESRYFQKLIGPYPEAKELYYQRSPIHFVDKISCPLLLFQGLEDKIVPPNQSEVMVESLRRRGLPVAYLAFEGEQHGFRKSETVKKCIDSELYFYSRLFEFTPADDVEPIPIENFRKG